jgi:hypothetical protein
MLTSVHDFRSREDDPEQTYDTVAKQDVTANTDLAFYSGSCLRGQKSAGDWGFPATYQSYCLAGLASFGPAAGFFDFCWTVLFFGRAVANRLKQLRRSSSSFTKRQSCTVLAGAETCFGSGFIFSS